jgi:hypothetical protein
MAIQLRARLQVEIKDGPVVNFQSNVFDRTLGPFDEGMGVNLQIPTGAIDQPINQNGINFAQLMYIVATQPILVKFVPQGYTNVTTAAIQLTPNVPMFLAFRNIIGIFVTNQTGQNCLLTIEAVGTDTLT